ncbi:S24 family peptidase [Pseudomonas aeruginosa]|nr:S24 family peptidase [Pseudomonas aeruginosa]
MPTRSNCLLASEIELSGGKGSTVILQTGGRKLRFGKYTLRKKNIDPASAAASRSAATAWSRCCRHGTVGVDTHARTIKDGDMYAFDHDGQLRVKLLYRLPAAACAFAASTATSTRTSATSPRKPPSTST